MGVVVSYFHWKMEALVNVTQMQMPMRWGPVALLVVGVEIVIHIVNVQDATTLGVSKSLSQLLQYLALSCSVA